MQLYVLDKDPVKSALLVPIKYRFKMLIELAQMISTLTNNGIYKPVRQGKDLVKWIDENRGWVYHYYIRLLTWTKFYTKAKPETIDKLERIIETLDVRRDKESNEVLFNTPVNVVFRYKETYACGVATNSLLDFEDGVNEYKKYLAWKIKG